MIAKIDYIKAKDVDNVECIIYPKTLTKCITDESGNPLENKLKDIDTILTEKLDPQFMTESGYGGLRYYNGRFQYYDSSTSTWVDTTVAHETVYVINMMPQTMQKFFGVYDVELGKNKLRWTEPEDTVINGQVACVVENIIIRRKLGEVPANINDGDLVIDLPRKDFGKYITDYFVDESLSPTLGEKWYYKAFPRSTTGFYNESDSNETSILCKDYHLFGFRIDQNESDPASMITYLSDCDNYQFNSAYMDETAGVFNYGDWTIKNGAWFMDVKPCMLKYDGTVDYYLDPNDYTKKLDGTESGVVNIEYEGNAMVGIPLVYYKIIPNDVDENICDFYICNKQLDSDYHCWSHINSAGEVVPYTYISAYLSSLINGKLRSLSGNSIKSKLDYSTERSYAQSNNLDNSILWDIWTYSDAFLLQILMLLIGKSTNSQEIFGRGYQATTEITAKSGNGNTFGLFYGKSSSSATYPSKIFGIEHLISFHGKRVVGLVNNSGKALVKMTYGQLDGSSVDDYNEIGDGYIDTGETLVNTSGNNAYIKYMSFSKYGLFPSTSGGSSTTYYCDAISSKNIVSTVKLFGSSTTSASYGGMFRTVAGHANTYTTWMSGTLLSCKPLNITTI